MFYFGGYEALSLNYPTLKSIVLYSRYYNNVELMLNFLISILGDSYSEFQKKNMKFIIE